MKVRLIPAAGALVHLITKDGKTMDNLQVASIEVEPFFSYPGGYGNIFRGSTVVSDGSTVENFELVVSGCSGKSFRRSIGQKSAVPAIDKRVAKKAGATGAAHA